MLAAEHHIRERLRGLPGLAGVHGMSDYAAAGVAGKRLPAAFVLADGYRVDDAKSPGGVRIAVQYLVVLAVRNVADVTAGSAAREAASDIASAIMARLYRYQPPGGYQPLLPTAPPKPLYEDGLLLYPLAFESGLAITKQE